MKLQRYIAYFFVAVLLTSFSFSVGKVFAVDEIFYSGNNILFYNPDAQTCSATTVAQSGDAKGNIYNFFISKGMNAAQSAGIVGNFQVESGLNPKALNSIGAYGLAQWLNDRKLNLLAKPFYKEANPDPSKEMQVQLDFVWEELQGGENGAYKAMIAEPTASAGRQAEIFDERYERSGKALVPERMSNAEEVLKQYGGTTSVGVEGTQGCTNTGAGAFVYYSQKDPKWAALPYGKDADGQPLSNIGEGGCGPTSLAMIIATISNKSVTPKEVADLGTENNSVIPGVGTDHLKLLDPASKKWGFTYQNISGQSFDLAIDAVKAGKLVYIGGAGEAPFTKEGHVIVMRGMTGDNNEKVLIGDPYRSGADVYDRAVVEAGRGSTYIISKN